MNKYFTINEKLDSHILVHIPHSSLCIPEDMSDDYLLCDEQLEEEKKILADMFTDELFKRPFESYGGLKLDVSRLFLDVERFRDDNLEAMSKIGMGLAYTKTSMLKELRTLKYRDEILKIYDAYHTALDDLVEKKLQQFGKCLIVDCHSFPSKPRPYQRKTDYEHIDVCIGFDDFHRDENAIRAIETSFQDKYSVYYNDPYEGSMVSNRHYAEEKNVKSVMIELNRRIYMDDIETFGKKDSFTDIVSKIEKSFSKLKKL